MAIELPAPPPPTRDIYTNRTLNLRAIRAIGYDMDYTLVHYHVDVWERRAFEYARDRMVESGLPVGHLEFDDQLVERGLIIDTHAGNVVKADRFGYVKAAAHGTAPLPFVELRELYGRLFVDLRDERWVFMSTLFDLSLAGLYSQCVDLLDAGRLPGVMGYRDLFARVRRGLDSAHIEGALKAEIMQDPASYVDLDPDGPRALLDQKDAGKKLLLITNSEWVFTDAMMRFAYERFLPAGMRWRDLFHMVIIQARKPSFFTDSNPIFEVINDQGHLRPLVGLPQAGGVYLGGHAGLVEPSASPASTSSTSATTSSATSTSPRARCGGARRWSCASSSARSRPPMTFTPTRSSSARGWRRSRPSSSSSPSSACCDSGASTAALAPSTRRRARSTPSTSASSRRSRSSTPRSPPSPSAPAACRGAGVR